MCKQNQCTAVVPVENIPLAFYHEDGVPEGAAWQAKIGAEIAALKARNVSFGMIIDPSADDFTDIAGIARGVGRYVLYHQLGLPEPDQYIVQSWETYPQHVLPEGPPTSLTFLLNYLGPSQAASSFNSTAVPIFRYLAPSGDRFYTASQPEGAAAGFTLEGTAFNLFAAPSSARVPVYRCSSNGAHFLSLDGACEGNVVEGVIGYSETGMSTGAPHPIFRCLSSTGSGRHLITTSPLECSLLGFTAEAYLGFAN